jgi:LysM domain-containing protein
MIMYKYIITPLLLCCLSTHAAADDVKLQDNHPDRYVVVKGDTLWDISGKFLKDPWQWPRVWKMNRTEIKNPHRIYPGDVVVLDTSSGSPQFRLLRERTVTLEPGVREEALEKAAIPTISPNIIEPFLSQPLVVDVNALNDKATIIGGPDNRLVLSPGTKAYVDKIAEGDGVFWNIYRDGKTLIDPITKEILGTEAIYLGDARVAQYGEPATTEIVRAKEEIFKGDKLLPAADILATNFVPRAPDEQISGHILSIYGGVAEAANNAIVTINRGSDDGLESGHVLAIYREGQVIKKSKEKIDAIEQDMEELKNNESPTIDSDATESAESATSGSDSDNAGNAGEEGLDYRVTKLPDERVGLLMIFRTFNRISYALVMQASGPVNVLDLVKTP